MRPPEPGAKYEFKTITRAGDGAVVTLRVRIPDCHPERPHRAHGLCDQCMNERRKTMEKARLVGLPFEKATKTVCGTCRREYVPLVAPGSEVSLYARFCSSRCHSIHEALQPGDAWRTAFPGAQYQFSSDVPEHCPRCSGTLFETETGAGCLSCGRDFAVAERLVRAILLGYDDAYAMIRHENPLEILGS